MSDTTTQAFYGRWERFYDTLATAPGIASWRRRAVNALDLSAGDTVVEMGCGTGANFPYLRERVGPAGTIVGLDVTKECLIRARKRVAANGWSNVHCCRADATQLPIDGQVDAILATFVVGMFTDPASAIDGWCNLCDGRVALLNFQRSDALFAAPVNAAFEGFVWLASPGRTLPQESPSKRLEKRVTAAREILTNRTVDRRYEQFAGGYLGLLSGESTREQ